MSAARWRQAENLEIASLGEGRRLNVNIVEDEKETTRKKKEKEEERKNKWERKREILLYPFGSLALRYTAADSYEDIFHLKSFRPGEVFVDTARSPAYPIYRVDVYSSMLCYIQCIDIYTLSYSL